MRNGLPRPGIIGAGAIVVVALLVAVVGNAVYVRAFATIRAERYAELRVIGALKVDQIVDWRAERLADADVGAGWTFTGAAVAGWLADPTDAARRADLVEHLDLLRHRHPAPTRNSPSTTT